MRGTFGGLLTSLLGLTLLEAFLSGSQTHNAGSILRSLGTTTRRLTDPAVPAIPDLRQTDQPQQDKPDGKVMAPPPFDGQPYDPWGGGTGSVSSPTTPRIPTPSTTYV